MTQVFGQVYADAYDLLYRDKDYDKESELLERVFQKYAVKPLRRVLDLGCGTGNHALRLAAKGYEVVGVDRSFDMLRIAERKAQERGLGLRLHRADIRGLALEETFDAVLMMFAVLCYQQENADVLSALRAARGHLHSDGLLVFDVWYGPAVLIQRPADQVRIIENDDGTLLRISSGELDMRRQICNVHFHLRQMNGDRILNETKECHPVRYFFPRELDLFLEVCSFRLVRLGAFPEFDRDPDATTWNVMVVAGAA